MTLAARIIPTVLCSGRQLIKGARFESWRTVGVAAQAVRVFNTRGVDELALLDIRATPEGRGPDLSLIEELSEMCFMPLAVGGGVRSPDDVRSLLKAGADKCVIGTGGPKLIADCASRFGSQAIVAALDTRDGYAVVRCGTTTTRQPAVAWARSCADHGAGEILLTSIDRDGTLQGYDLDLIRQVSEAVSIPVIANGGCSGYGDMVDAVRAGAHAVAAGALFAWTDATPRGASQYLKEHGIHARVT